MHAKDATGGRVAFVTGATYGIGAAIAHQLAADGFALAISATQVGNLAAVRAELEQSGARVLPVALDLRSLASVEAASDAVLKEFGQVDVLVNNAGIPLRKAAIDITAEDWDRVIETNVRGTFFMCQRFGRHFIDSKRPGCIVNLASTHGALGLAGVSAYGISKAAIMHMTKTLAIEWADHGIRVNAVAPGTVATKSRAKTLADPQLGPMLLDRIPLHRFGTPEDVAGAVAYLVSPGGSYITGQTLLLDGGLTAGGSRPAPSPR